MCSNLRMQMDVQVRIGAIASRSFVCFGSRNRKPCHCHPSFSLLKPFCSKKDSDQPLGTGNSNSKNNGGEGGGKFSTDWDEAWASFKKRGKKSFFSQFSPNKYVTWNPRRSEYPLSEEVDPIKKDERSILMLWTSPEFALGGAIVIVTFLLVFTILAPVK